MNAIRQGQHSVFYLFAPSFLLIVVQTLFNSTLAMGLT